MKRGVLKDVSTEEGFGEYEFEFWSVFNLTVDARVYFFSFKIKEGTQPIVNLNKENTGTFHTIEA